MSLMSVLVIITANKKRKPKDKQIRYVYIINLFVTVTYDIWGTRMSIAYISYMWKD